MWPDRDEERLLAELEIAAARATDELSLSACRRIAPKRGADGSNHPLKLPHLAALARCQQVNCDIQRGAVSVALKINSGDDAPRVVQSEELEVRQGSPPFWWTIQRRHSDLRLREYHVQENSIVH